MSARHAARLQRLESRRQAQQGMPPVYILRDDDKLAARCTRDKALVVRLARKLSEEEWSKQAALYDGDAAFAVWPRPIEREAPPPKRPDTRR